MADFISLHPEEWVALISGLRFSAAVAQSKIIFIPVVILAIGWSLLVWLYRLEKDREWNAFILWLIFSSAIILSAFRTQKVVVELNPIVLNTNSMMLSIKQEEVKVNPKTQTIYYNPEASGISALLAIPDKIASLMFNFMDANLLRKLTGQAKTIPLDNLACKDPRYVAGLVQLLTLDWALGLSLKGNDDVNAFNTRVQAFEECYRSGFKGYLPFINTRFFVDIRSKDLGEALGRGLITTLKSSPVLLLLLPLGWEAVLFAGLTTLLAGAGTKIVSLIDEKTGKADCGKFIDVFKDTAEQIVANCEKLLGVQMEEKDKRTFVNAVVACLADPGKIPDEYARAQIQCLEFRDKTISVLETAKQAVEKQMNINDSSVKNFLAGVVSEVKAWWFSTTYMDFPLKFDLLAKGQGIVLALLTGMFPFVAVLSVIPTGRSFMNWSLLLNYMIAYFMVKMWIPLLFFIVNVATHNLVKIIGG